MGMCDALHLPRLGPYTRGMTTKEQLRQLVDGLDEGQAAEVLELLRKRYAAPSGHRRRLPFVGTLHAEADFAERSEDILRDSLGRTA